MLLSVSHNIFYILLINNKAVNQRTTSRVARLGEKAPFGRLLAAVGALKFGFGALLATFWATF